MVTVARLTTLSYLALRSKSGATLNHLIWYYNCVFSFVTAMWGVVSYNVCLVTSKPMWAWTLFTARPIKVVLVAGMI